MNASGDSVFLQGDSVSSYSFNSEGARPIEPLTRVGYNFGTDRYTEVLQKLLTQDRLVTENSSHIMESEIRRIASRSITAEARLTDAFGDKENFIQTYNSTLGSSFLAVARAIRASSQLGLKRQIFVISHEGYDLHAQISDQAGLYSELDTAIGTFFANLDEIGLSDNVTLFTGSEFGRTLSVNGDGTDHGWGAHHVVYGGQFTSTLAKWFGATDSEISELIVPDIGMFNSTDLGFMQV